MSDRNNLTKFLLARIAEDQASLDTAAEAEAEYLRHDGMPDTTAAEVRDFWLNEALTQWPRLLAECEAKRRIITAANEGCECQASGTTMGQPDWDLTVLKSLALPYINHPGYLQKWKL